MQLQIRKMSNADPGFYELLGPLMGSRQVEKEVGIRLYDDAIKTWYLAFDHGVFLGVASVRDSVISDCYVKPEYRRRGAMTAILAELLDANSGSLRATCTGMSRGAFEKAGFTLKGQTLNFYRMERAHA